jgi:hypothetical protein
MYLLYGSGNLTIRLIFLLVVLSRALLLKSVVEERSKFADQVGPLSANHAAKSARRDVLPRNRVGRCRANTPRMRRHFMP